MDMRQKLLPIFLREADINLGLLQRFLQEQRPIRKLEDLETVFRAAHTLKGTAQLVRADSIHSISRRLEAMLEKHLSAKTSPSGVEIEAMQLAVEWLFQLVAALSEEQPEPKSLVSEALHALDLAGSFPGATPLVELLDSAAEQRAPNLDDPFSSDPELQIDEAEILRMAQDPFADDPDLGFGLDAYQAAGHQTNGGNEQLVHVSAVMDPFADDAGYDNDLSQSDSLPHDPFQEDSFLLETHTRSVDKEDRQDIGTPTLSEKDESVLTVDTADNSFVEYPEPAHADEVETLLTVAAADPFGDDPAVEEEIENPADEVVEQPEPELRKIDSAKDFVESLLLPKTDEQPRRDYVCCSFTLSGRSYYLPIKYMVEISEQPLLLPLPLAPKVVKGLINLRGQVIPVIDLAALHQKSGSDEQVRRLVIAEHKGEKLAFLAEGIPYLSEVFVGEKIELPKFIAQYRIRGAEE